MPAPLSNWSRTGFTCHHENACGPSFPAWAGVVASVAGPPDEVAARTIHQLVDAPARHWADELASGCLPGRGREREPNWAPSLADGLSQGALPPLPALPPRVGEGWGGVHWASDWKILPLLPPYGRQEIQLAICPALSQLYSA